MCIRDSLITGLSGDLGIERYLQIISRALRARTLQATAFQAVSRAWPSASAPVLRSGRPYGLSATFCEYIYRSARTSLPDPYRRWTHHRRSTCDCPSQGVAIRRHIRHMARAYLALLTAPDLYWKGLQQRRQLRLSTRQRGKGGEVQYIQAASWKQNLPGTHACVTDVQQARG